MLPNVEILHSTYHLSPAYIYISLVIIITLMPDSEILTKISPRPCEKSGPWPIRISRCVGKQYIFKVDPAIPSTRRKPQPTCLYRQNNFFFESIFEITKPYRSAHTYVINMDGHVNFLLFLDPHFSTLIMMYLSKFIRRHSLR